MQEIATQTYIETGYAGVTLGAIVLAHGLILIDAPLRGEDTRSWRASLTNLGGGADRLLVNLDAHYDRTLATRAMDCTVVAQEKTIQVFRNRPVTFKPQVTESGAAWEITDGLSSARWVPPEMTFTQEMHIYWDKNPVVLEYRPGPATGSTWVILPDQHVIFLGDAVVLRQPPFLGGADLPNWIDLLRELLSPGFRYHFLVSGRGGLITVEEVRQQLQFLEKTHKLLETLAARQAPVEEAVSLAPTLLADFKVPAERKVNYHQRLRYGLRQYYLRHYHPASNDILEE